MSDKPLDCIGLSASSEMMLGKHDCRVYVSVPDKERLEKLYGKLWVEQNCKIVEPITILK